MAKTLLDEFAIAALQGLLAQDVGEELRFWRDGELRCALLVNHAYELAEAMMEEHERLAEAARENLLNREK